MAKKKKILAPVGRVVRPHGLQGELVIEPIRAIMEPVEPGEMIYLGEHAEPHEVADLRHHRARWLLRIAGCEDRDAAEAFRGCVIQIERLPKALPPGQFYDDQLVGLTVVTDDGEELGILAEIIVTGANDVYVVTGPNGEILLPAIPDVVRVVDVEAQRMTVHLLDGLR